MMEGVVTVCYMRWNGNIHLSLWAWPSRPNVCNSVHSWTNLSQREVPHYSAPVSSLSFNSYFDTAVSKPNNAIDRQDPGNGSGGLKLINRKALLPYFFQTITWLLPRYSAVQSFRRVSHKTKKRLLDSSFLSFQPSVRIFFSSVSVNLDKLRDSQRTALAFIV